jgi:hypothetical protein
MFQLLGVFGEMERAFTRSRWIEENGSRRHSGLAYLFKQRSISSRKRNPFTTTCLAM